MYLAGICISVMLPVGKVIPTRLSGRFMRGVQNPAIYAIFDVGYILNCAIDQFENEREQCMNLLSNTVGTEISDILKLCEFDHFAFPFH